MWSEYFQRTFAPDESNASTALEKWIGVIILLSIMHILLETEPAWMLRYGTVSRVLEVIFLCIFSIEYVLRLIYCAADERYRGLVGRIRFVFTPYAVIDLIAILPSIVFILGVDLLFMRVFRLVRLLRLGRFVRDNVSLRAFIASFIQAKVPLLASLCVTIFVLFVGAILMFFAEGSAQPEAFGSVPRALWWAMATLTTVGYGDVYPITPIGRMLASAIAILGIGVVAMPAGIIAANFSREMSRFEESER